MPKLEEFHTTVDVASGTGTTITVEQQRLYVPTGGRLKSATAVLVGLSSGPCFGALGYVINGFLTFAVEGTLRADANYNYTDGIYWTGDLPTTPGSTTPGPFLFTALRNDTGSTVTLRMVAQVEVP